MSLAWHAISISINIFFMRIKTQYFGIFGSINNCKDLYGLVKKSRMIVDMIRSIRNRLESDNWGSSPSSPVEPSGVVRPSRSFRTFSALHSRRRRRRRRPHPRRVKLPPTCHLLISSLWGFLWFSPIPLFVVFNLIFLLMGCV